MKVLIAGDYCQKYRVDSLVKRKEHGNMFSSIRNVTNEVDYAIVNFEFPIITNESIVNKIKKCGPTLMGSAESIDAIKYAGFHCCTLANNHILDQGEECCIETKELLNKEGLEVVGVGQNLAEASKILYKSIKGKTIAVINCCEHEFSIAKDNAAGANPLNPIYQYQQIQEAKSKADYVLIIVHGGHEHFQLPSIRMQETYRFFIDVGADAVINHHQHCYSGYETYKGRPIFYGLGNLLFDHQTQRNTMWNEGYMVVIDFSEKEITFNIIPYTQCRERATIRLMDYNERRHFDLTIANLNSIISDKSSLKRSLDEYYLKCANSEINNLEPYQSRFMRKLYRWGMLPHCIKGKKALSILNHIDCESHRDKLLYALKKKI